MKRPYWKEECKKKWIDPSQIGSKIAFLRSKGKTICTLNGSFDLLHAGHLHIIYEAKKLADILLVALNSDSSIRQYKGPDRPIVPLEARLEMISAIEFIDFITWFDETDPRCLLDKVRPDFHVNGAEYGTNCIEAETVKKNGGKLVLVDRIDGLSTSQIIKKIHTLCAAS